MVLGKEEGYCGFLLCLLCVYTRSEESQDELLDARSTRLLLMSNTLYRVSTILYLSNALGGRHLMTSFNLKKAEEVSW